MLTTIGATRDRTYILEALVFLLEREGLSVTSYSDGVGCFEHVLARKPDMLVLDLMLPNVSGMQILEQIRRHPQTRELPVLMLTAKGQKKDRQAAEDAGVSKFMTKPFANSEIVATVKDLLNA